MGTIAVKIKIMPVSPEADLEKIKEKARGIIEKSEGGNCKFEEEPIAFRLKAVIVFFEYPEEKELDSLEKSLSEIENVNSVQVVDIRRGL